MKPPLFVFHNGRRGQVLLCRPLYRALAAAGADLTIGACCGDGELLQGLGPAVRIVEGPCRNGPHGSPVDLAGLCPGHADPLEVWLGGNGTKETLQWADVLEWCGHELAERHLPLALPDPADVPMLDFAGDVAVPELRRPSVWLDPRRTASPDGWFVFDFERLARVLRDFDLLCPAPPPGAFANVVDVSHLGWARQSRLSERCLALVGAAPDPFVLTMTEANRHKPKALCGYDARVTAPFWDYPGNPLELLSTMDDLVDFVLAHVATAVPA